MKFYIFVLLIINKNFSSSDILDRRAISIIINNNNANNNNLNNDNIIINENPIKLIKKNIESNNNIFSSNRIALFLIFICFYYASFFKISSLIYFLKFLKNKLFKIFLYNIEKDEKNIKI